MRTMLALALGALALAAGLRPVLAEDACAGFKWPLARERAALSAPGLPVLANGAAYPGLDMGVTLTLAPQAAVAYTVKPTHTPKSDPAYGGEFTLADAPGGMVQVTMSDDAWVDVVQDGKPLRATAFSGKAGCADLRKSVRFTVVPGPVTISISDAPMATLRLDVTTAP